MSSHALVGTIDSDAELLLAWRGGERPAGEALIERYRWRLARFFERKLPDSAGDLVQQTLIACIEGKDRLRCDQRFRAYLFAIAHNLLRLHLRGRRGRPEAALDEEALCDLSPGPVAEVAQRRAAARLLMALQRIPKSQQVLISLRYWDRLKGREIGALLALPENTVRSRLLRAQAQLRRELGRGQTDAERALDGASFEEWAAECRELARKARVR